MAVYTQLGAEALAGLIGHFDVGALVSAKGIAEGVSNSNWLIETSGAGCAAQEGGHCRFILTVYEARTEVADLPFFLGLLDHLAARGCPVPRTIHDRAGAASRMVAGADGIGKPAALIEFLPGVSVSEPTPAQARAVGEALAQVHLAAADFGGTRANGLGLAQWGELLRACGPEGLAAIPPELATLVDRELAVLERRWPTDLPRGHIHADLFPDNVFFLDGTISGIIDFYFAATDLLAYDVAVCINAWCFEPDLSLNVTKARALVRAYDARRPLTPAERAALPVLCQGAAMRFALTRLYDWLNTPEGAMVTRKDPMEYVRRLRLHMAAENASAYGI